MDKNKTKNIDKDLDDVLIRFRRFMTETVSKEANESGLSLAHFEVIRTTAEKDSMTMKEVASLLHITPPSASALVDKLVEKELIKRLQPGKDRRTVEIALGDKAHKLFHSFHKKRMCMFKKTYSKLDQKDKEDLIRIINKSISNF